MIIDPHKKEVVPIDKELLAKAVDLFQELPTGSLPSKLVTDMCQKLMNVMSQKGQVLDLNPQAQAPDAPPPAPGAPPVNPAATPQKAEEVPKNGAPKKDVTKAA